MKLLEERIVKDGRIVRDDVLKVDSFLNHQMDTALLTEIGKEFFRLFKDENVNKILTIEASGIGMAITTGQAFGCPVLFAKKSKTINVADDVYTSKVYSFTHETTYDVLVSKRYLTPEDRVLIIDDFLANGEAINGLISLVEQAGATLVGAGAVIEKEFQGGGNAIRAKGIRVESLAKIKSMSMADGIKFC